MTGTAKRQRYRAQERNKGFRGPRLKASLRARAYDRDQGICQLCGTLLNEGEFTLDRVDPSLRYSLGNVQIACLDCNNRKGDQVLPRFAYRQPMEEKLEQLKRHYEKEAR